jgi:cell division protein FtsB
MTAKTRERLTYATLGVLILAGTALYARHRDLLGQWERYQKSEEATRDMQQQLQTMEESVAAAKERARNMDKDPVEKEATVRRISKGVRGDEIVFRVEEEPSPARP